MSPSMQPQKGPQARPEAGPPCQSRWLSQGWESLLHDLLTGQRPADAAGCHCDVLIIGSGYGGAIAAAELAGTRLPDGRPARVWVLERGQEYLPGSFPSELGELPGHVRFSTSATEQPAGRRTGLFDVRLGAEMCALVGSGLGGGSLINAGVMDWPTSEVFDSPAWPQALRADKDQLAQRALDVSVRLGAHLREGPVNGVHTHGMAPDKNRVLQQLGARLPYRDAPITVALVDQPSSDQVQLDACVQCGDCATGCNHNAKISLDTNLLAQAQRLGAKLITGATAWRLAPGEAGGWQVEVIHTDDQAQRREGRPHTLRAHRVILAAGTLGSTELLMRSQEAGLPVSSRLGQQFSGNGDMITVAYDLHDQHGAPTTVNAVAHEHDEPAQRQVGPTITGILDRRDPAHRPAGVPPHVIEDLAVPGPMQRLFGEIFTTARALQELGEADTSAHHGDPDWVDPMVVSDEAVRRSLVVALIGHDQGNGQLKMPDKRSNRIPTDGQLHISWPTLKDDPRFLAQENALAAHCAQQGWQMRVLSNPGWKPLPDAMEKIFGAQRGPLLTVHPLGGCAMADDARAGVVDHLGRVFNPTPEQPSQVHEGLVVMDGAIVPCSLGINPALTIATLAQRNVLALRALWGFTVPAQAAPPLRQRPRARPPQAVSAAPATEVELAEQLRGWAGQQGIELTLHFRPQPIRELIEGPRRLEVDPTRSEVRVIRRPSTADSDARGAQPWHEDFTLHRSPVQGTLTVLHREASTPAWRTARGLGAWFVNRGLRDVVQALQAAVKARLNRSDRTASTTDTDLATALQRLWQDRVLGTFRLASRAGEVRLFDYDLTVLGQGPWAGERLQGQKRLTYACRGNPWLQLMQMQLNRAPGLPRDQRPLLTLNLGYLADEGVPLMRVIRQRHMPDTLMDLISLGLMLTRVMLHQHVWSLRKPDTPEARPIHRLPVAVEGLPPPEVIELDVAPPLSNGTPVRLRLTRYRGQTAQAEAVLMLHGYSAGGTTYAHRSVPDGLGHTLWTAGFDVWVADMRTSPGMPTATKPWTFEDPAYHDIPVAVDHVWRATGQRPIHIFAHCMGSAMLWMGLLGPRQADHLTHEALRVAMPDRIRRVALSQIAPVVTFDPANVFRAFVMRYFQQFMPLGPFYFRPETGEASSTSMVDQMLDRLLSTLPYPVDELRRQDPFWPPGQATPWAATRHRMDILYGRDFKLSNISEAVLRDIDEHFGPLSLKTLSQAMQLARNGGIATPQGDNLYLDPHRMRALLARFPVMSVHGRENALSDIRGLYRFKAFIDALGPQASQRFTHHIIDGYGHQDCLIGENARADVFPYIVDFLKAADDQLPPSTLTEPRPPAALDVQPAPYGPFLGTAFLHPDGHWHWPVTIGRDTPCAQPAAVACVTRQADGSLGAILLLPWPDARPGLDPTPSLMRTLSLPEACWPDAHSTVGLFLVHTQPGHDSPRLADIQAALTPLMHSWSETDLIWIPRPPLPVDQPDQQGWSFMLSSCLYPGSMAERTPDAAHWQPGPADQAWQRLLAWRTDPQRTQPELAMLLGDQIYADATAGLFDPRAADGRFNLPYQSMLSLRWMRHALNGLPVHTLVDDHEIVDNWSQTDSDDPQEADNDTLRAEGLRAYRHFQRFAQPVRQPVDPLDPTRRPARLWYTFTHRGLPFFMANTRTQRTCREVARLDEARIMGRVQWAQLEAWLTRHGPDAQPSFVATPSILLPRRLTSDTLRPASALMADAWESYPGSLHALLALLYRCQARHVVFLSGDEHVSCVARITLTREGDAPDRAVVAHSVHSSALYAPYPFANSRPTDFHLNDSFSFRHQHEGQLHHYHCRVETEVIPGDGFAILACQPDGPDGGWQVTTTFNRQEGLHHRVLR
ncbi:alpha/beta fold hydrolase [Aquabacterium sp.]|uniref:alpha/beta fold hydrolase n=1 Tax=Aquabacterium sp. TaxID=1872578 RepID=UPI0035AF31AF